MNPVSNFTPRIRRERTPDSGKEKDAVSVFCRLRPLKNDQESTCIKPLSPTILSLSTPAESNKIVRNEMHYQFKHIFTAFAEQKEIFEHVAYPLLEDLLKGKNGLLFTYGVKGSGKTYTLTGDQQNPGILPKCIQTIFNTISSYQAPKNLIKSDKRNGFKIQSQEDVMEATPRSTSKSTYEKHSREKTYINDGIKVMNINESSLYSVFVSYIKISNNTVFDLLEKNTGMIIQGKNLREDSQKNIYVNPVIESEVKSAEEAFELFNIGQQRKKMADTVLSCHGHYIFTIRVVQLLQIVRNENGQPIIPDSNLLKVGQLSLVHLAASERSNRTHQNTKQLLKDILENNSFLLTLRTCLEILRENQLSDSNKSVPYKDSRLTLLFKNFFEGEGRVEMIVCMNPSIAEFDMNLQVIKFGETTQDITVTRSEPKFTSCKKKIQKKTATSAPVKTNSIVSVGPKLPDIQTSFLNIEEAQPAFDKLINTLKTRQQIIQNAQSEDGQRINHFRERLIDIQQENICTKALLKKNKQEYFNVKSKLAESEARNLELNLKVRSQEAEISFLRSIIAKKNLKLHNEKMTQEFDAKLRPQREHLQAATKAKENKLEKVRQIPEIKITPAEIEEKRKLVGPSTLRERRSRSTGEIGLKHNVTTFRFHMDGCWKVPKGTPLGTFQQPSMWKHTPLGT